MSNYPFPPLCPGGRSPCRRLQPGTGPPAAGEMGQDFSSWKQLPGKWSPKRATQWNRTTLPLSQLFFQVMQIHRLYVGKPLDARWRWYSADVPPRQICGENSYCEKKMGWGEDKGAHICTPNENINPTSLWADMLESYWFDKFLLSARMKKSAKWHVYVLTNNFFKTPLDCLRLLF